jgi:ParB family chromosome partitioning protein
MNILGAGIDAIQLEKSNLHKHFDDSEVKKIPIYLIEVGGYQPRKKGAITVESIQDLISSIKEHGILQPIILRYVSSEKYELIAGERRLQAAIQLNMPSIPAVVKNIDVQQAHAIAIIENIQREQLSLLEEAEALLKLRDDFLMTVDNVAKLVGKPRTTISNLIRVASQLSDFGKDLLEKGEVDYGHIRTVLILDESIQNCVLSFVVEKKLSVRQTEKFVKERGYEKLLNPSLMQKNQESFSLNDEFDSIIRSFSNIHGLKAKYRILADGKIRMSIDFDNVDCVKKILF